MRRSPRLSTLPLSTVCWSGRSTAQSVVDVGLSDVVVDALKERAAPVKYTRYAAQSVVDVGLSDVVVDALKERAAPVKYTRYAAERRQVHQKM